MAQTTSPDGDRKSISSSACAVPAKPMVTARVAVAMSASFMVVMAAKVSQTPWQILGGFSERPCHTSGRHLSAEGFFSQSLTPGTQAAYGKRNELRRHAALRGSDGEEPPFAGHAFELVSPAVVEFES